MAAPKTKDCITNGTPGTSIEQKNKNIMEQYSTPKKIQNIIIILKKRPNRLEK